MNTHKTWPENHFIYLKNHGKPPSLTTSLTIVWRRYPSSTNHPHTYLQIHS